MAARYSRGHHAPLADVIERRDHRYTFPTNGRGAWAADVDQWTTARAEVSAAHTATPPTTRMTAPTSAPWELRHVLGVTASEDLGGRIGGAGGRGYRHDRMAALNSSLVRLRIRRRQAERLEVRRQGVGRDRGERPVPGGEGVGACGVGGDDGDGVGRVAGLIEVGECLFGVGHLRERAEDQRRSGVAGSGCR
jgi:hypothetical protein